MLGPSPHTASRRRLWRRVRSVVLVALFSLSAGCLQSCPIMHMSVIPQGGFDFGSDGSSGSPGLNIGLRGLPPGASVGPDIGVLYRSLDAGSEFGAWAGVYAPFTQSGDVELGGLGGLEWRRFSYSYDEFDYEIPDGLGGGAAAFQEFGGTSQNALAVRLGFAASLNRPDSRWTPTAQLTYNVYVAGAEFGNHASLGVGIGYALGAGDER